MLIIFHFIMYIQLFILSLQAAKRLKITAIELCKLKVADGVIPVIILLTMLFSRNFFSYV